MSIQIGLVIVAIIGLYYLFRQNGIPSGIGVTRAESKVAYSLDDLYKKHAKQQGVEWQLLKALAQVESNENPNARNPSDPSTGLMQVLCVPDGKGGCSNKFNILGWPPESEQQLYDPDYNLHIASQILSWNQRTYGWMKGIAVYNSWSARTAPEEGPFPNQGYVDKVLAKYRALTPTGRTLSV